ncbi:MAG: precorrin-4 C(11)-methyltransferase [spirochete symbiont of Stewartia floridana]|nr:MAG: precorrin-4 C(11)-methyltransferase [spirochete symbiont of Stewartia floridana]
MKVYFVGAGPGDPQLITVKGRDLLTQADIVIYTGSLVPDKILKCCRAEARLLDSAGMNLDEILKLYFEERGNQGIIVRLHTGDPALYGAIQEQIDQLHAWDIPFHVVPGVSSFQAASAILERQFTLPGVSQTIVLTRLEGRTAVPESERLEVLAESRATLVIFLSVDRAGEIQRRLIPILGQEMPIAVVYRATWEDQVLLKGCLGNLEHLCNEAGISRHALIIVGRVLDCEYEKSRLYSADFSHGYRQGQ